MAEEGEHFVDAHGGLDAGLHQLLIVLEILVNEWELL